MGHEAVDHSPSMPCHRHTATPCHKHISTLPGTHSRKHCLGELSITTNSLPAGGPHMHHLPLLCTPRTSSRALPVRFAPQPLPHLCKSTRIRPGRCPTQPEPAGTLRNGCPGSRLATTMLRPRPRQPAATHTLRAALAVGSGRGQGRGGLSCTPFDTVTRDELKIDQSAHARYVKWAKMSRKRTHGAQCGLLLSTALHWPI